MTSVHKKSKSGDFCAIWTKKWWLLCNQKDTNAMQDDKQFFRSMNISDEEEIGLVDRWILACLIKGLQGKGNISKISLDKIAEYCKYTNEQGKEARFGTKTIQASIDRLEAAKLISIIKPNKRGQCTKYKIKDIKTYEKINDEFFNLDLSPTAKGYILCMLQHNLNKDDETHQPNDVKTKTTYNIAELSNKFHTPIRTIYKAEKMLKDSGILTIQNDPQQKRDQETGLIIQNRELDLQKLGLDAFVQIVANHEQRLQTVENNRKTDKEEIKKELEKEFDEKLKKAIKQIKQDLYLSTVKDAEIIDSQF